MVVNRGCSHDLYRLEETAVSLVPNYRLYTMKQLISLIALDFFE